MAPLLSLSKVLNSQPGWYRGDFHAHTNCSDGALTPPQLAAVAKAEGLDFFTITDHNTIDAFPNFGEEPGLLILPGIEITLKEGDYNVFGMEGLLDWMEPICAGPMRVAARLSGEWSTTEFMRRASTQGLLNSINHPLLKPWDWNDAGTALRYLHCLEIWNDPSWPDNAQANPQAVALWTDWLNAGHRITAIGGSDYHRPAPPPGDRKKQADRLGLPSTYVYAEELSGHAVLAGLRQRRAYVSMGARVAFEAQANGVRYGIGADLGEQSGAVEFSAVVLHSLRPGRALILKNGKTIAEAPVDDGRASLQCSDQADASHPAWYRLDVLDPNGLMLAVTNPIFVGPRRDPVAQTFGDFVRL